MDFLKEFWKKYLSLNKYQQARVVATIGTAIISLAILLILLNAYLRCEGPKDEEGLEVAMGMPDAGGNDLFEPTPLEEIAQELEEIAEPDPVSGEEAYQTQDIEESAKMDKAKTEEELQKERELAEKRKREKAKREAEQKRIAEEKRLQEERQRRQDSISAVIAQRTRGLKGGGGSGTEESTGKGGTTSGTKGNPFGNPNSTSTEGASNTGSNRSYSLAGRTPVGRIAVPTYSEQVEGRIVLQITVDKNGNVISAVMTKGTTVDNASVINAAINAAKKTKFSAITQDKTQTGIITYDLKLK